MENLQVDTCSLLRVSNICCLVTIFCMLKVGIIGLPNVGKSTLFNALIARETALAANYPFATIEPNVGVVAVPDERLPVLEKMNNAKKVVPATIEFVDIAGLVRGASKGEGLGNQFLASIRETDAVIQVVRCFEKANVHHVEGSIDPIRDIETVQIELVLADLESVKKRMDKTFRTAKSGDKKAKKEIAVLDKLLPILEEGRSARNAFLNEGEKKIANHFFLLTTKPIIYVANVAEGSLANQDANPHIFAVKEYAKRESAETIVICAKTEEDIIGFDSGERTEFLNEMGVKSSGVDQVIKSAYKLLGLMSFLTAGEREVRAWTVPTGTKAREAAGKIHSDIERGFIRAEIISFNELVKIGSESAARAKGLMRLEGKDYIMQEGDIANFRFNV